MIKVQKAGECLVLNMCVSRWDIEPLVKELSPNGLLFGITCDSEAEFGRCCRSLWRAEWVGWILKDSWSARNEWRVRVGSEPAWLSTCSRVRR